MYSTSKKNFDKAALAPPVQPATIAATSSLNVMPPHTQNTTHPHMHNQTHPLHLSPHHPPPLLTATHHPPVQHLRTTDIPTHPIPHVAQVAAPPHLHPRNHLHQHPHVQHQQHLLQQQMQHLQQHNIGLSPHQLVQQQHEQQHQQHQQHQQQHNQHHNQHQQQQPLQDTHQHHGGTVSHQNPNAQQQQQQQSSAMLTRFDANKSTKGASKLRRDLINAEIANLRDLLPLPQSTRQRLSQLQLMALVCVYVRKANYFQQVFKRHDVSIHPAPTPNIGFSKALSGFLMMLTQNGKLLYISDNAAEYLGHSMEDLLIHGDSVYDIIDKQDHSAIQAELNRNVPPQPGQHSTNTTASAALQSLEGEHRMFLCRMNVSRNARRQMRFGDQKVVLVQGHYLSFLPLCSRNEPVFLATCTPIAMPETRECVVQGATNVFTTIHSMDMKIAHIDKNGEFYLSYSKIEIQGISWYKLIHSDYLREAQSKHRLITQSEQDRSCILLMRMQRRQGDFLWVHVVLQVRDSQDTNQQPVIVCTNQVLNEREASVMIANSWLYHYYTVQSKIQFGLPYEAVTHVPSTIPSGTAAAAAALYYHHTAHHHHPQYHHHPHHPHHHPASTQLPGSSVAAPTSTIPAGSYPTVHHHPHHHAQYHVESYGTYNSEMTGNSGQGNSTLSSNGIRNGSHTTREHTTGQQYFSQHRLGTEPVDYSQDGGANSSPAGSNNEFLSQHSINGNPSDIRCSSANSTISCQTAPTPNYSMQQQNLATNQHQNPQHHINLHSPPAKKHAIGKLEPLYLPEDPIEDPSHTSYSKVANRYPLNSHTIGTMDSHASVVFATVVPTRPRFISKALPTDPPDFIDQWNPSPPWSETAHKISLDSSSSSHQDLSPCITTTPPTPTSAPPNGTTNSGGGNGSGAGCVQTMPPAFSFEWMSDQLVPISDACVSCLTPDGMPLLLAHASATNSHHIHTHQPQTAWSHVAAVAALSPRDHHQHLSQHLASRHGYHRLHHLSSSSLRTAHESHTIHTETSTKAELAEDADNKVSPQ